MGSGTRSGSCCFSYNHVFKEEGVMTGIGMGMMIISEGGKFNRQDIR